VKITKSGGMSESGYGATLRRFISLNTVVVRRQGSNPCPFNSHRFSFSRRDVRVRLWSYVKETCLLHRSGSPPGFESLSLQLLGKNNHSFFAHCPPSHRSMRLAFWPRHGRVCLVQAFKTLSRRWWRLCINVNHTPLCRAKGIQDVRFIMNAWLIVY
jgi:hypothetical protein